MTKNHLVAGVIVALALWPIAHHVLYRSYDTDPWKLYGLAMYCTPRPDVRVSLTAHSGQEEQEIPSRALSPELRTRVEEFARRRRVLGRLESPRDLAMAVMHDFGVDGASVTVHRHSLEAGSGRARWNVQRYRYGADE